jgi:hypothetical protein
MLSPLPEAAPALSEGSPADRLSIARGKKQGEWAELQVARANDAPDRTAFDRGQADSRFLSFDAMPLLHEAFARALPGFDLFLPRLFDAAALGRLRTELTAQKAQLAATPNVSAAKARWGEVSTLVAGLNDEVAWLGARAALMATIEELLVLAADLTRNGQGLWILGF